MNKMSLSQRLREALDLAEMRQAELSRRLGIAPSSVSLWLSGRNHPDAEHLSKLAVILDVSYEWLSTGRGEMRYSAQGQPLQPLTPALSTDERALLDLYLRLSPVRRRALMDFLHAWK